METKFLSLWLEGPLQSWGYDSAFSRRETLDFPTKSGVLGLLLSAMGKGGAQEELLKELGKLPHTVFSYVRDNQVVAEQLMDFQMVGSGYSKKGWESFFIPRKRDGSFANTGGSKMTYRFYLQDAVFSVIAEIPLLIADEAVSALKCPVWPIFLGRRTCIPSRPIFNGIYDTYSNAENAVSKYAKEQNMIEDFMVVEGNSPDDGDVLVLRDVPISFGISKKYKSRYVTIINRRQVGEQSPSD